MASEVPQSEHGVLRPEEALRFLDEASGLLAGSLDYERTLAHVAQLMVPAMADWCAVDVAGPGGALRQITSGHPDPEQERLLEELRRRYRAERGASEGVRRVIDTGEAELRSDVTGMSGSRVTIRDEERELYERLGPKSYVIVPLSARGRTLGAMTLLSTRPGRHYGAPDLGFARHLAQRFAVAIDNARLFAEAEHSRSLLEGLFATAPVGLGFLDTELRFVRVNQALADMLRRPVADHIGRTVGEVLGGPRAAEVVPALRRVLAEGTPLLDVEISDAPPHDPAGVRHLIASYAPLTAAGGEVIGITGVVIDVTDRRRALEAEREAARRSAFLAEAGALLDASLDYEEILGNLVRLAVPDVGDWCRVALLDEDGELIQVAAAHADPASERVAQEIGERYPAKVNPAAGAGRVLATGRPDVVEDITGEMLAAVAVDDEHLALLEQLGLRSGITAPLVARGRILGTLSLAAAGSGRRYSPADVQLLVELGRRAGVVVENARLYTERSRIAHTLQASLLPSRLNGPPGVRMAARYRAAGEFNEVGGDFYDAFQRAPDEWVVIIGDVSGKGPEAAALTALARHTIRAAALNDWAPADVLRRLNETLLHEDDPQFITVALAFLSHDGQDTAVRLVLGGHPLPCVVRADGSVTAIGTPGTVLGAQAEVRLHEVRERLAPGDGLVLFTDGVTEAGARSSPLGEQGVIDVLEAVEDTDPERLADALVAAALQADNGRSRDDVAVLALQALAYDATYGVLDLNRPALASELSDLREAVVEFASALPGIDPSAVRTAVGEACANVVVHAYRLAAEAGDIHVRALAIDGGLVVEVRDEGCGPSPRIDSPGLGLGMPLMATLARELQILDRAPHGTLVRLTF